MATHWSGRPRCARRRGDGLVALGTTAETAALTSAERRRIVDICAEVCCGTRRALIVGTGSNSTAGSIDMLADLDPRVTAALTVVPYYTPPDRKRRRRTFSPPRRLQVRCRCSSTTSLTAPADRWEPTLSQDSPGNTERHLVSSTQSGRINDATIEFHEQHAEQTSRVLAGDDFYAGPLLALGANWSDTGLRQCRATRAYADLITAWRVGPTDHARRLGNRLVPLARALFAEPNPVVIKAVLAARGQIPSAHVRLPLLASSADATATALEWCAPHVRTQTTG